MSDFTNYVYCTNSEVIILYRRFKKKTPLQIMGLSIGSRRPEVFLFSIITITLMLVYGLFNAHNKHIITYYSQAEITKRE